MKSILFKSFILNQMQFLDLVQSFRSFPYTSENGEGIQIVDECSDYVRCVYCYDTVTSQPTYNPITNEFTKIEVKRIELIPFIIDHQYNTIDVIGNKQKCAKVVDILGRLTKFKIAISDSHVDPVKILLACSKLGISYRVNKIKIRDYVFFDNIVGNCVLNLSEYDKTDAVLSKYSEQIVSFTVALTLDDSYTITFYRSGAITLHKDFEELDIELIRILKKGL